MKSVLDILIDNLKIGRGGFSNEKQIYGVLASSIEIEKKIKDVIREARIEELEVIVKRGKINNGIGGKNIVERISELKAQRGKR